MGKLLTIASRDSRSGIGVVPLGGCGGAGDVVEGSGMGRPSSGEGKVLSPKRESFMNESSISSSIISTSSGTASGSAIPDSGAIVWSVSASAVATSNREVEAGGGDSNVYGSPCALR